MENPKYIITQNIPKENKHWDYCSQNALPFILANGTRKYYRISIDMYCSPYNLTDEGVAKVDALMQEEIACLPDSLKNKADYYSAHVLSNIYPIEKERVEEVCSKLFEIGTKYREFVDDIIEEVYKKSLDK